LLFEVFSDKQTGGMKRESTLRVQSEKPPAYAGRRERQAPAPRLRLPETPYVVRSEAKHRGGARRSGEQTITKYRPACPENFGQKERRL
jgi:hypothetical protein